jgi:threonine/homoserine/homoserine lactone efflux protein
MNGALYAAFVAATLVMIAIPGPNVALIVGASVSQGRRMGLVTVAGTSCAMAVQLSLTVAGMASVSIVLAHWFEWLRWAGVAYLAVLAILAFRAKPEALQVRSPGADARTAYLRGLGVGLTNPKTLLFYGAFLPQFVDRAHAAAPQLAILAATFLALAVIGDGLWAVLAGRLKGLLAGRGRLRNRLTGAIYLAAGLGLAGARTS